MKIFSPKELKKLYIPPPESHKGQNGKLLLIGGSHLFHAASLWALSIASRVVDMVFYASVPENAQIVQEAKKEFRNGIVIRREDLDDYVNEADAILIGPGMLRTESRIQTSELRIKEVEDIDALKDEGEQTYYLTKYLLERYPEKKFVIDAGALQMLEPEWLLNTEGNILLTPHLTEFARVFHEEATAERAQVAAEKYHCTILLKGHEDIITSPTESVRIPGGNAGMTKGGTGDVLAGLVASFACTNELFISACAGSYLNKKAAEALYETVGYYYNASDLVEILPRVMKQLLL